MFKGSVFGEPGDITRSLKVRFISVLGEPGDITRSWKVRFIFDTGEPGDIIESLKVQFISVTGDIIRILNGWFISVLGELVDKTKSLKIPFISVLGATGDITRSLKVRFNSIGSKDECNNKFFKAFIHSGLEFQKLSRQLNTHFKLQFSSLFFSFIMQKYQISTDIQTIILEFEECNQFFICLLEYNSCTDCRV